MNIVSAVLYAFIGIYFSIALYHFMVWLGRKRDTGNLLFSLMALAFCADTVVYIICGELSLHRLQTVANYVFTVVCACVLPRFGLSTGIATTRMKRYIDIGSALIVCLGAASICFFLAGGNETLANAVFFGSLLLFVAAGNVYNLFSPAARRERRGKKLFWFQFGYVVLIASLLACISLFVLFNLPINSLLVIPLFHLPFVLMLFIFEFALVNKFNGEHAELNSLKNDLERKVEERTRELRDANDQKTQFIVNFAHETKTPLTLITNHLDAVDAARNAAESIGIVRQYVEKLRHDMVNILDHEKLERGQVFYDHHLLVNASRLLDGQIVFFARLARRKRIGIEAAVQPDVFLKIDPLALESVINNLLDNAVRYTQRDGSIAVRLEQPGRSVRLTVSDTGPGIPPGERKTVFQPYYQLSHRKRSVQGIGMGLNIVKKIMEQAGGTITLDDAGRGASFVLEFPGVAPEERRLIVDDADAYGAPPPCAGIQDIELSEEAPVAGRPAVLVVDDHKDIVACLQRGLCGTYNVFYALSGREALEKIRTIPKPDVIVSDIMMDGMDGYALFDRLTADGAYASVPFIFLTALTARNEKLKGIGKGAVDFISKPFRTDELKARIDSLIRMRKALLKENMARLRRRLLRHLEQVHHGPASAEPGGRGSFRKELLERYGISKRQTAIIALLKGGLLRKEISDRLDISINTLNTQIRRIFKKCRVQNKTELLNIFTNG